MKRKGPLAVALALALVVVGIAASRLSASHDARPAAAPTSTPEQRTLNCAPARSETMTNTVSHLCGFADTTNTGPRAGTNLTLVGPGGISAPTPETGRGWQWANGELSTTAPNAVIENVAIARGGVIQVLHDGATIRNCTTETGGDSVSAISLRHASNVTIENCVLRGLAPEGAQRGDQGIRDIYGDSQNLVVRGVEIYWQSSCLNNITGSGLIERVYCHDMAQTGDDHVNGIQLEDGPHEPMVIRDSTFLNDRDQADAIMLANDNGGTHENRRIEHNLLAGGSFCFYGRGGQDGTSRNITVVNNHFSRLYHPTCGSVGAEAYWSLGTDNSNVWADNVWDDTGEPVTPNI